MLSETPDGGGVQNLPPVNGRSAMVRGPVYCYPVFRRTAFGGPFPIAIPLTITWRGHDFLENAREPAVWSRALELSKKAGSTSLSVITEALTKVVLDRLKTGGF
jgi:hypothetical protein